MAIACNMVVILRNMWHYIMWPISQHCTYYFIQVIPTEIAFESPVVNDSVENYKLQDSFLSLIVWFLLKLQDCKLNRNAMQVCRTIFQ